jgi:uncharacterized protein (TIGR02996 family)
MRTFQFSDAKSHKFWNIEVTDTSFTVTYGKIGTAGQTTTKSFPTPEKAQAEADKLVKEKVGKGYTETTPKATVSDDEAFEKTILDNPNEYGSWAVYADYLMEKNDPRGEFMQVQLALEDESKSLAERKKLKEREKELLKQHQKTWLGSLAEYAEKKEEGKGIDYQFQRGWLSEVHFRNMTVNQARAFNKAPEARLVQSLTVEGLEAEAIVGNPEQYIDSYYEPGPDVPEEAEPWSGPSIHALCRCPHFQSVQKLILGEDTNKPDGTEEEYFNCHMSGELAHHLVKQMPNIEELYLFAHRVDANKLFALPMPKLRVLQLYHTNSYPLEKLAANPSLTKLTHLLCHPHAYDGDEDDDGEEGGEGAYIRLSHLRAICKSKYLTSLTHLRLRLTVFGNKGVKEIVQSGILKRLKVLDLHGGCITDEGAELLAKSPDLKNLELLNLSVNAMTPKGIDLLKATGVKLEALQQHTESEPGDYAEYLFNGDIE